MALSGEENQCDCQPIMPYELSVILSKSALTESWDVGLNLSKQTSGKEGYVWCWGVVNINVVIKICFPLFL